ncbi:MAG: hypothetical protein AB4062_15050 [Crocosphaera sp.]
MNIQQNGMDQAAVAREEINQQIKLHRQLLEDARQQVQELVNVQITTAKEEHQKLAQKAAQEAVEAQMAAQEQISPTAPSSPTSLAELILLLSEGTGVDPEEIATKTQEATETASQLIKRVSQMFNSASEDSET